MNVGSSSRIQPVNSQYVTSPPSHHTAVQVTTNNRILKIPFMEITVFYGFFINNEKTVKKNCTFLFTPNSASHFSEHLRAQIFSMITEMLRTQRHWINSSRLHLATNVLPQAEPLGVSLLQQRSAPQVPVGLHPRVQLDCSRLQWGLSGNNAHRL